MRIHPFSRQVYLSFLVLCAIFISGTALAALDGTVKGQHVLLFIPYRGDDHSFSEAVYHSYVRFHHEGYAISVVQNADELSDMRRFEIIDRYYASGTRSFILAGAEMSELATTAAQRHRDAYFAVLSGVASGPNVINYCLDCRRLGGLLAGEAAAKMSTSKIVGFVGGVKSVEAAEAQRFKGTVQRVLPGATVLIDWTGSWSDRSAATRLTERQIAAGADVIVADANTAVISAASRYPHVKVIGWMTDTRPEYKNVVASVIINADVLFRRFIDAVAKGDFKGGEFVVTEADHVWVVVGP